VSSDKKPRTPSPGGGVGGGGGGGGGGTDADNRVNDDGYSETSAIQRDGQRVGQRDGQRDGQVMNDGDTYWDSVDMPLHVVLVIIACLILLLLLVGIVSYYMAVKQ